MYYFGDTRTFSRSKSKFQGPNVYNKMKIKSLYCQNVNFKVK